MAFMTSGVLWQPGGNGRNARCGRLAAHGGHCARRRGRPVLHRGPQEGHYQVRRLPDIANRDRNRHTEDVGRGGGLRDGDSRARERFAGGAGYTGARVGRYGGRDCAAGGEVDGGF
uniref:(northern house mosquito) hypothetical protein n=1 Tax=Culex pipiens TaxID=7175 RepID=A0A8D8F1Y9_CULPI